MSERGPNILLQNLVPPGAQKGVYRPEVGHTLTVSFPGEDLRCEVTRVFSDDGVLVEIIQIPFRQGNEYKKGDAVPVRRGESSIGTEIWEAISRRELRQLADAEAFEAEERQRAADKEAARKQALIDREQAEINAAKVAAGTPEPAPVAVVEPPVPEIAAVAHRVLGPRRNRVARVG